MSFTVQKSLGNSFFRFAVTRRREFRSIDPNPELSTGSDGEFIRHRQEIFYSADRRTIRTPEVPKQRSISATPITTTLMESVKRSRASMIMMGVGAFFILLGLLGLSKSPAAGAPWLIIGLILLAVPVLRIANQRRLVRQHEERIHREREEREARNRELLAAYAGALERLRETPDDATIEYVRGENEKLDLPYSIWADTAIGTVLHVGFSELARVGPDRASEVAELMDRASDAAGLISEDALAVKQAVYSTILWHFLADDRLGEAQLKVVRAVQEGFKITDADVPNDASAEAQFQRLRGIDHRNAPRCEANIPLNLNEYCLYTAPIRHGEESHHIHITNKRIVVSGGSKPIEMPVPTIDDIVVDADANRVTLRSANVKVPVEFGADEPIYLAAMADLATRLDDRPKSFT